MQIRPNGCITLSCVFIDSYYGKLFSFWWFNVGSHYHYIPQVISLKLKQQTPLLTCMLLPVQLSLPLFYEKTGLYLSSKLDQRNVWNDTRYLFLTFFYVCSVNKLPFPNCNEAYWVSKRPVKDFFSGRMARIRPQNDNSGPKRRVSELPIPRAAITIANTEANIIAAQRSHSSFEDEIRRNSLFIHHWFYVTYLTTSQLWQILYFLLSNARWIDLNDSLSHETSLYYFICRN